MHCTSVNAMRVVRARQTFAMGIVQHLTHIQTQSESSSKVCEAACFIEKVLQNEVSQNS